VLDPALFGKARQQHLQNERLTLLWYPDLRLDVYSMLHLLSEKPWAQFSVTVMIHLFSLVYHIPNM
jgi:hypothetical protein